MQSDCSLPAVIRCYIPYAHVGLLVAFVNFWTWWRWSSLNFSHTLQPAKILENIPTQSHVKCLCVILSKK